jgi:CheY-like chemotaxis protein
LFGRSPCGRPISFTLPDVPALSSRHFRPRRIDERGAQSGRYGNPSLTAAAIWLTTGNTAGNSSLARYSLQGLTMYRIDFNKLRFLICDDNPHMRRILRTLLHSFGAREAYEAEDGATALEMYTHYVPDIVITDWSMPIFDGIELAQMIRQPESKGNPYAPIIMLTGHSEKRRVTVARDAGVTEFLAKPISAKGLYQRILNVVANPRPFIKTKTYFGPDRRRNTGNAYIGPERRVGGEVEVMQQPSLLDKARAPI